MHCGSQRGHVIYVKRKNYLPVFLAPEESYSGSPENSPRNSSSSTSPLVSGSENGVHVHASLRNHENDDVFVNEGCSSEDSSSQSRLSAPPDFFLEQHHDPSVDSEFSTGTTRTLSSRFSIRYSSNISKMKPQTHIQCFCDGYFGCPDEEEKRKCKGRKKTTCASSSAESNPSVPWLRRLRKISWYKHKENTSNALAPYNPVNSSTNTLTRGTLNYMDRTRKTSTIVLGADRMSGRNEPSRCTCSGSCSSAFCNYCLESSSRLSHNHSNRWSCDGYFGCPDEKPERRRKGKKKNTTSVTSLPSSPSSQSVLKRFLGSRSSIRSTDLARAPQGSQEPQRFLGSRSSIRSNELARAPQGIQEAHRFLGSRSSIRSTELSRASQGSEEAPVPVVSASATVIVTASKKVTLNGKQ